VVVNTLYNDEGQPRAAWEIVRGRLGVIRDINDTQVTVQLQRLSFKPTPFRYPHRRTDLQPGQVYTLDEMVDDLNADKYLEACQHAASNPLYRWLSDAYTDPQAPKPNTLVPACGVLAVNDRGEILLQRRRDTGQWALPMGKQEIGETPTECAVRETKEETGVEVEIIGLVGIYSDPAHIVAYADGEVRQEYEVTLLARPVGGAPSANDEASDVRWFAPAELAALDIHPTMRRQIADYLSGSIPHVD